MYKVFVVDDEIVVREGIRDGVKWNDNGFIFSGEAPDGELALMQIQEIKPDILITDIRMPFMNGLKLSKIVRKNMPWIKIIILSGHNEFKYAKEAISIGVTEYILKPVSAEDLIVSLNKTKLQIEDEKKERENIEKIKKQLDSNMPIIKGKFLSDFIQGIIPIDYIIENSIRFKVDLIAKYYIVSVIDKSFNQIIENDFAMKNNNSLKIDSIISSILGNSNESIFFKKSNYQTIIIFKGDQLDLVEEIAYSYSQSIKYETERNTQGILSIGIGGVYDCVSGVIQSYEEAQIALKYKFAIGKSKIIGYKDVKTSYTNGKKNELEKIRKINIIDFLKYGIKADIDGFLDKFTEQLNVQNRNFLIYSYHFLTDIILTSSNFINELEGDYKKVLPEVKKMEDIIASVDSIGKFREYSKNILTKVFEFRDSKIQNKYGRIIEMAKDFINEKYSDQEISLNVVSSHVNVSPSHFSTIFSQETGETFIEYLTKIRVKKAMELLKTTNSRSSEVAYSVGYNDPRYFTYLFKKITKKTPIEFRNYGKYGN